MGRDPIGGRATNLIFASEPQDIYQEVADHVIRRIRRDAETRGPEQDTAQQWFGLIDRNVVKNANMTTLYGVTQGAIYKHLLEEGPARFCRNPQRNCHEKKGNH
jgi:DNA-directed RNA polymerase